jgi:hypothetical protein
VTVKGNILLYGGVSQKGAIARKYRNFKEELWFFNTTDFSSEFQLLNLDIEMKVDFLK